MMILVTRGNPPNMDLTQQDGDSGNRRSEGSLAKTSPNQALCYQAKAGRARLSEPGSASIRSFTKKAYRSSDDRRASLTKAKGISA
jgi:hypothetical protein